MLVQEIFYASIMEMEDHPMEDVKSTVFRGADGAAGLLLIH